MREREFCRESDGYGIFRMSCGVFGYFYDERLKCLIYSILKESYDERKSNV